MNQRIYLNTDWQFVQKYTEYLHNLHINTADIETVRLPHSTAETPFHYFDESVYQHNSAYRRLLHGDPAWKGQHVLLTVEAAAHESEVFLNGKPLLLHRCGYTAYTIDLAPISVGARTMSSSSA